MSRQGESKTNGAPLVSQLIDRPRPRPRYLRALAKNERGAELATAVESIMGHFEETERPFLEGSVPLGDEEVEHQEASETEPEGAGILEEAEAFVERARDERSRRRIRQALRLERTRERERHGRLSDRRRANKYQRQHER